MEDSGLVETSADQARRIEAQVEGVRRLARSALRLFLQGARTTGHGRVESQPEPGVPEPLTITANDLDRYAIEWAWIVPEDPTSRAHLAQALNERFGQGALRGQRVRDILHLPTQDGGAAPDAERVVSAVDALEYAAECMVLKGGETLMRQGEASDDFYVVLSGRLAAAARATTDADERIIRELVRGTSIGEMAALTGEARSARVFALRDSHLLRVPRTAFDGVVARFPEVLRGIILTLVTRAREGDRGAHRPTTRTLAVLPLNRETPTASFIDGLIAALARHGSTRAVNAADAEACRWGDVEGWLNGLEETHRFVVYQGEPSPSAWTARCIRQADRILLLAGAAANTRPGPVEHLLGSDVIGTRELVLLHTRGAVASNTSDWLAGRQVVAHHHVRLGNGADMDRLARRLVGRAIGVVLGGGGARGFAHIGALRALHEAGVPTDAVGGASAGAIIAAQCALGWDVNQLHARNRELARRGRNLLDYTVPLVALLQARKFMDVLHELFGDRQIEDLWLPFWCLSSNLTRADKIVHRSGSLATAVRASCALPGVLPPVLIDGDVVVDGGLIDNIPVAIMSDFLADGGVTVAFDVSAQVDLARPYSFGASVSGVRLLLERLNPLARPSIEAPSMAAVLLRSVELGSVMHHHDQDHDAENQVFIKLPVSHIDRLAFNVDSFEQLVDIGYSHTRKVLETSDVLRDWTGFSA
ncbi:MAG TPA: patatin-like phospholipase family protein, partial [Chloroflexota bacterium]